MKKDIGDLIKAKVGYSGIKSGLYSFFSPELIPYLGKTVQVAQYTKSRILVWDTRGKFICIARIQVFYDSDLYSRGNDGGYST